MQCYCNRLLRLSHKRHGDDVGRGPAYEMPERLISFAPSFIATILPSSQTYLTATRERWRGVVFSGSPRALDQTHYKTQHLHFPRRDWVGPPWHIDPTAARKDQCPLVGEGKRRDRYRKPRRHA